MHTIQGQVDPKSLDDQNSVIRMLIRIRIATQCLPPGEGALQTPEVRRPPTKS